MDTFKIGAQHIDSFQIRPLKSDDGTKLPVAFCAMKGCRNRARVKVYYRESTEQNQQRSNVCMGHALALANDVLSVYKFKR
jgi:hypothetical protein